METKWFFGIRIFERFGWEEKNELKINKSTSETAQNRNKTKKKSKTLCLSSQAFGKCVFVCVFIFYLMKMSKSTYKRLKYQLKLM